MQSLKHKFAWMEDAKPLPIEIQRPTLFFGDFSERPHYLLPWCYPYHPNNVDNLKCASLCSNSS